MNAQPATIDRRFDLDWLRVLTVFAIFGLHHATRFFDTDEWLIKNATTYLSMQVWLEFCTSWGMPLILLISGASAFFALEKTRPGRYVGGLFLRLFVPLVVGMFTYVAFLVYLEHLHKGTFSGSFLAFYPHFFEGMYGFGGNFAWMGLHLWYLELLLVLSLLCLPIFLWFKRTSLGQRALRAVGNGLANPMTVPLLAIPTVLLILNLNEADLGNTSLGGWSVVIYPQFYLAGFVLLANERLQAHILRMRWMHLAMGMVFSTIYLIGEFQRTFPTDLFPGVDAAVKMLDCFVVWSWLLAVLGFGTKHLNFNSSQLKYANEAALPFYILHFPVLLGVGYFVVSWGIPDMAKYVTILTVSLALIMALYEFGVRRFNLSRFLFGMKPKIRPAAEARAVLVAEGV